MKRKLAAVALAAASLVGVGAQGGIAGPAAPSDSQVVQDAVTAQGVTRHLERFQAIADRSDDNRAAGFPGHDRSADYVERRLDRAGWTVSRQAFDFHVFSENEAPVFEQTAPAAVTYEEGTDFFTMEFSGTGDVTAELVAVDLELPPGPTPSSSDSGCEPEDFDGLDVTGKIALMQRGTCDFSVKVDNAAAAGAAAAIIFNEGQPGRTEVLAGTLTGPNHAIPAVGTTFALGDELAGDLLEGPVTAHIKTDTSSEMRESENVIAETPGGNPDDVVMAGAHLDSVQEGPGINDNGSGSAALIRVAEAISKEGIEPENKLRFVWWSAEETGLDGSTYFIEHLTDEEYLKIALYLNFDMIGSPNFARFIYDGNGSKFEDEGPEGSDTIERVFERHFERNGLASGQTAFDGRSDYGPFIAVGIPAGGLFTGAEGIKTEAQQAVYGGTEGEAYDPCYHEACDDIDNISQRGLGEMSDAVAHSVVHFGSNLKFIPRPEPALRTSRGPARELDGSAVR